MMMRTALIIITLLALTIPGKAQTQDFSVGLANKHSYFINYKAGERSWVNYYQASYAYPLSKAFSLTGHLSFAQDATEEVFTGIGLRGEPRYAPNGISSTAALDIALRWNALNLRHHQVGLYVGPSIKRQAMMSSPSSYTGFFYTEQAPGYVPFTLQRLQPRQYRESYEVGTDSRWIGGAYLAVEYIFYPIEQLGIGYTFRTRAQSWFLFEDVSIGPVLRYRWAGSSLDSNRNNTHGSFAIQVLPTYVSSVGKAVTQLRTQYRCSLSEQWGVVGNVAYLQGSRFSDENTQLVSDYYQYHSTVLSVMAAYQLYQHNKHQLTVLGGPAYRWGARSYAENIFNALDIETDVFYYDPNLKKDDDEYIGDALMVEVKPERGWGGNLQLGYTYQLTSQLGLGGVIDYQHYTNNESLIGMGMKAEIAF